MFSSNVNSDDLHFPEQCTEISREDSDRNQLIEVELGNFNNKGL